MPNKLSIETAIDKSNMSSKTAYLVALEVSVKNDYGIVTDYIRVVRNNEDVVHMGNLFVATNFDITVKSEVGEMPSVQVTISDFKRIIQHKMQQHGGGVGFGVKLMVLNSDRLDHPPETVEFFEVIRASAPNYQAIWELGTKNPLTSRFPRRKQMRDRCSWRYKSAECGYKGALSSCDLSLRGPNGCAAHNNTPRFGGCPGIGGSNARFA